MYGRLVILYSYCSIVFTSIKLIINKRIRFCLRRQNWLRERMQQFKKMYEKTFQQQEV